MGWPSFFAFLRARGLKKHLKTLNALSHWILDKLGRAFVSILHFHPKVVWDKRRTRGQELCVRKIKFNCCLWYKSLHFCWGGCGQAPKPSPGPHKERECLPLVVMLRSRLKYALTYREVVAIVMQRLIAIDGKVCTDKCYPAGFMGRFFLWTYQKMLRCSAWWPSPSSWFLSLVFSAKCIHTQGSVSHVVWACRHACNIAFSLGYVWCPFGCRWSMVLNFLYLYRELCLRCLLLELPAQMKLKLTLTRLLYLEWGLSTSWLSLPVITRNVTETQDRDFVEWFAHILGSVLSTDFLYLLTFLELMKSAVG